MPASKAQQRATNKYISKAYDRINLTVLKGRKDVIQAHAADQGESVNGFINRAIDSQMIRDASGEALGEPVDDLTIKIQPVLPGTLAAAEAAAKAAGEKTVDFIAKAIRDARETHTSLSEAEAVSLPSDALKAAREAAEASGEALPVFIGRAVETQAQRDKLSRKMKGGKTNE